MRERGIMRLNVELERPGCADGKYIIKAKGCIAASLHWGDAHGILGEWTAFAYVPVSATGVGEFIYSGGRAIPEEACCVIARGISSDFSGISECRADIPRVESLTGDECGKCFVILSDIHMTYKTGRLLRALRFARSLRPDALLMAGDLVNDGLPEQFSTLAKCIAEEAETVPLCCVTGNHDYPLNPLPTVMDGICDYPSFQSWILQRDRELGIAVSGNEYGDYRVQMGDVGIISLNAVSHWRRFGFYCGGQLEWLKKYLDQDDSKWKIILCHAPLWGHNPQRRMGYKEPYLPRDGQLQKILDAHKNVIFISGHTHISPNVSWGCVEYVAQSRNLYINAGSICPTGLKGKELLVPSEWSDGNVMKLEVGKRQLRVVSYQLHSGKKISRGYYILKDTC